MIRVIVTRVLFFLSLSKIDVNHSSLPNKAEPYNICIYIYKYTDIYIYVYISLVISSFSPATDCLTPSLNNVQHKQRSLDRHPPSNPSFLPRPPRFLLHLPHHAFPHHKGERFLKRRTAVYTGVELGIAGVTVRWRRRDVPVAVPPVGVGCGLVAESGRWRLERDRTRR